MIDINKKTVFILTILATLFLISCTSQAPQDPRVEEFLKIYPGAEKESETYKQESAITRDFFSQECEANPPYTRTTYKQYGATLILYTHEQETLCATIDIEPGTLTIEEGDPQEAPEGVALLVNDEPILFTQIEQLFNQLPEDARSVENLNAIANQLISQKLLEQEIAQYDVNTQAAIQEILQQNNLSQAAFEEQLLDQDTSFEAFEEQLRIELGVQQLLEDKFGPISVDEEEAQQFYLDNTDAFIRSEQATFQQVFVQETNQERAQQRIDVIARSLNNSDFCTVVTTYSDDEDSKERCGIYTIPRGVVFSELEYAVFNNEIGEPFVVQGPNGYHIINVLERQDTNIMPYSQAQSVAREFLEGEFNQLRLNAYLSTIRSQAQVITYLTINDDVQEALEQ